MLRALGVALCLAALPAAGAQERLLRERTPEERPALMILGTAHFANPGRDVINRQVDDVLAPKRQAELQAPEAPRENWASAR